MEAKFDSSSMVDKRVVSCEVRFSADLMRRLVYRPVFFTGVSRLDVELDSDPRQWGSRNSKFASFLGACLAFQWQALGKSHWFSQCLNLRLTGDLCFLFHTPKSSQPM